MFKLQRPINRYSNSKERVEFKFSNFQALQVPKGWDRLSVSLVSVETGKVIAKLGKTLVKNGICQWGESLSESIYISRDESSKGYEDCFVKLLVSTGSTRSSILGELTINLANYTSSRASAAISQPLKKCNYGTILQVKIQCLTSRSKIGDEGTKNSNSQERDLNINHHEGSKSNGLDDSFDRTVGSQGPDLASTSHPLKLDSKETSRSSSVSIQSFDSLEGSIGRKSVSTRSSLNYDGSHILDNFSDESNSPSNGSFSSSRVNSTDDIRKETVVNRSSMTNVDSNVESSRNLLEDTIDQLRAEAKMWERNARKLMFDLDMSRKENLDLSKKQKDSVMELSAANTEHDGLMREQEILKLELDKLKTEEKTREKENPSVQSEILMQMQKELENEIKYQKDLSDDLSQQLKQSQESNIELVSVLQEMEETVEKQRIEMDSIARNTEENRNLLVQLKRVQESERKLQGDVQLLEEALRDKTDELENKWRFELSVKDEEIDRLKAKQGNENIDDLVREVKSLRIKVQELDKDCTELTDENLELLFKLKDSNKNSIRKSASFGSISSDSEVSDPKFSNFEDEFKKKASFENSEKFTEILEQLDMAFHLLASSKHDESGAYNDCLRIKENTETTKVSAEYILSFLVQMNKALETRIGKCDKIVRDHENEINEKEAILVDAKKKMEEYEKLKAKSEEDYAELVNEFDRKRSEVELVEGNLLLKNQEIDFLLQHKKELEAEIRHLEDEKEFCLQEIDSCKSVAMSLQDENEKLKVETETQILNLKQKSEDMQKNWIEAQEQYEYLQADNKTLQASAESLVQENDELKSEIEEMHKYFSEMESQLSRYKQTLSQKVEYLEGRLTSVLEDFALKEKSVELEVDALVKENNLQKEKLDLELENLSKQIFDADKLEAAMAESESKFQDLTRQLAVSEQNHETLMADHDRVLKSLATYRKSEEKLKSEISDLELKLTISDYERKELTKEIGVLKNQLQNMSGLHEEISIMKRDLEECRIEKGKLEAAFVMVSGDYEQLKTENIALSEKISGFEECKWAKLDLEQKLVKMENELSVKEMLCSQKGDLENELTEMKRTNVQIQQKMYRLEEEKDEHLKKVHELEEQVKLITERYNKFQKQGSFDRVAKDQLLENDQSRNSTVQRYERTKSSLETELRELKERYLEMSLKYAEAEGEREDLVMKLRATKSGKRWFS